MGKKKKTKNDIDWDCGGIHKLWHAFSDHMTKKFYQLGTRAIWKNNNIAQTKRKYRQWDARKIIGWDAICHANKFTKEHSDIITVRCDDSYHAGSDIFLIPHEGKKEYWGTTVMFIPQCCDEQGVFFLYPEHLDDLVDALLKLQKKQRKNPSDFYEFKHKNT